MRSIPKILLFLAFFVFSLGFSLDSRQIQANDARKPLLIAAAGDIACDPNQVSFINPGQVKSPDCQMLATSDLLKQSEVVAVLPLGDTQYQKGSFSAFQKSYGPTWGRLKKISHPVPGNHEYETEGASGYYQYFGAAAGDPQKGYYSIDLGQWHLIALNSNCDAVGGCEAGSPQERWLKTDLATHPKACTLAYWHHPRFSSGLHGSDERFEAFLQDLYQSGAELILAGHDHDYERFAPQGPNSKADRKGVRAFVVGTGGASHYAFKTILPNSEVRNSDTFGVLQLTLLPNAYQWKFVPVEGKSFTDSGSDTCH
jgi:hypothetical protein